MLGRHRTASPRRKTSKGTDSGLSLKIMDNINAGAINDVGVHGLAESLHISERHLRRLVQAKTGTSPLHFNHAKRLAAARLLLVETKLSIIDIAFAAEFSSLRQFNDAFKEAFHTSPSKMRKAAAPLPANNT